MSDHDYDGNDYVRELREENRRLTEALAAAEQRRDLNKKLADGFSIAMMTAEARIDRARKILAEGLPVGSPESRLASDLREVLGDE